VLNSEPALPPQSLSITSAALLAQFCLFLIAVIGLGLRRHLSLTEGQIPQTQPWAWVILLAILGLGPLILSRDMTELGRSVMGGRSLALFQPATAVGIATSSNILLLAILVARTGGSRDSPFTSALLLIPTFAIFLWQSYVAVTIDVVLVALLIIFTAGRTPTIRSEEHFEGRISFLWVVLSTLVLATFISYITRKP
jgi:hypothetical protein